MSPEKPTAVLQSLLTASGALVGLGLGGLIAMKIDADWLLVLITMGWLILLACVLVGKGSSAKVRNNDRHRRRQPRYHVGVDSDGRN